MTTSRRTPEDNKATTSGLMLLALVLTIGLVTSCADPDQVISEPGAQSDGIDPVGPNSEPPTDVEDLLARLDEAREEQERLQSELGVMSVEELVELLANDATRGIEPFNSLAFREIQQRGEEIAEPLAEIVRSRQRPSHLEVVALREVNRTAYLELDPELVSEILVKALVEARYFNTWGIPHLYWEDAALAIIEQGRAAIPFLEEALDDDRAAAVFGSEEVVESERFGYRVKDYALALLLEIGEGGLDQLPVEPAQRDAMIDDIAP